MFINKNDDINWNGVILTTIQKKKIKDCSGIAKQVRGHIVYVEPHPKFKGVWQFKFNGEIWLASDWAFED